MAAALGALLAAGQWAAFAVAAPTAPVAVRVAVTDDVIEPDFIGVGYNLLQAANPDVTDPNNTGFYNEVYAKRLREVRPGFVRLNSAVGYRTRANRTVGGVLRELDALGTTAYLTEFAPPYINVTNNPGGLAAYAQRVAATLQGYLAAAPSALKYFCWTNELSLCLPWDCQWGSLVREKRFDIWGAYYRAIHGALADAGWLGGGRGMLATDASPTNFWWTMDWALGNVDNETAIYGGHHYPNNYTARDAAFYPWWLAQVRGRAAKIRRVAGKRFVVGETGGPQYSNTHKNTSKNGCADYDGCAWFDTPDEPHGALQLVEQAVGAINGGAAALAWWTFFSEHFLPGQQYARCNDWGASKWNGTDTLPRTHYDPTAHVSRALTGPGASVGVSTGDPLVRTACVAKAAAGPGAGSAAARFTNAVRWRAWSCVVVNRRNNSVSLDLALPPSLAGAGASPVRVFGYGVARAAATPPNPFGDLSAPVGTAEVNASGVVAGVAVDGPGIAVLTTDYRADVPADVEGVRVHAPGAAPPSARVASWRANAASDSVAYYRVFARCRAAAGGGEAWAYRQIRSTVATSVTFSVSPSTGCTDDVRVCAVNAWGNHGGCP